MIERGPDLWFYHEGRNDAHSKLLPFPKGAVGLATLPVDRFCALEAGPVEGFVETPPFGWRGDRLSVASFPTAGGAGYARVEIRRPGGDPIEGFSAADAIILRGGSRPEDASWKSGASLAKLQGETVLVRVYLVNQKLYALYPHGGNDDDISRTGPGGAEPS